MFNLLRADLWRFFNTNRLRGQFWSYFAVIVAMALLVFGLIAFVGSEAYANFTADMDPESISEDPSLSVYLSSITTMLAYGFVTGGFFPLVCGFCAAEFTLSDLKAGYLKNIVSGVRGKLAYFTEKLAFCCIASAILLAVLTAACLLSAFVFRLVPAGESIARIAGWLALTWLNGCAFAALTVVAVWAVRGPALSYIWAILLSTGVLRELIMGLAYSSGGALRVLQPIAPALKFVASWIPSTATQLLSQGGVVFDMPMAVDGVSIFDGAIASGTAGLFGAGVQTLIISVLWTAIACALALAIARKRDVA